MIDLGSMRTSHRSTWSCHLRVELVQPWPIAENVALLTIYRVCIATDNIAQACPWVHWWKMSDRFLRHKYRLYDLGNM
jgi:hypothetical protein